VPTVLLVRHGRTAANAGGVLAGWTPGIGLDETGRKQVQTLAQRLAPVSVSSAVASPLQRTQETATALLAVPHAPEKDGEAVVARPAVITDERLGECKYGEWTGRAISELTQEPLWRVVQAHPSAVVFPGAEGESMLQMQLRAVTAVREHDARVAAEFGPDAVWLAVSHGDVIKAILADALGMHFDQFQRIVIDPASLSVIRFTPLRPFVLRLNDSTSDLGFLSTPPPAEKPADDGGVAASDAVIGGGAGGRAHDGGTA
jgi:probable phosphomutase (TIGR03848 family)